MKRFLLDSGIVNELAQRDPRIDEVIRAKKNQGAVIGTTPPVVGELWAGVELSSSREKNEPRLRRALNRLTIWPYDVAAAEEFGRLRAVLRRIGRPMQQIDIQIAAVALSLGNCTVVSTDSDLFAVPGLDVVNWVPS